LREQRHDVRLVAAQFVKPFVKSNKNDFLDAEAIAEAVEARHALCRERSRYRGTPTLGAKSVEDGSSRCAPTVPTILVMLIC
jgi:hypothetical protein